MAVLGFTREKLFLTRSREEIVTDRLVVTDEAVRVLDIRQ
jgi:hypothetical protein